MLAILCEALDLPAATFLYVKPTPKFSPTIINIYKIKITVASSLQVL